MNPQSHGIGTWLQHSQQASIALLPEPRERRGDGGGVMGEIIVNLHAVDFTAHLQAAFDATEATQSLNRLRHRHTGVPGCSNGRKGIMHIVLPELGPAHLALRLAVKQNLKVTAIGHYW